MVKHNFDKKGIKEVIDKLKRRANAVKQECAFECSEYLLNFGYHIDGGGPNDPSPGYTGYYAANWNQSLNVVDRTLVGGGAGGEDIPFANESSSGGRRPFDDIQGRFLTVVNDKKGDRFVINEADLADVIYVSNPVYYGRWLNDGGELQWTFSGKSQPNRFLELCQAHLESKTLHNSIIRKVKKEIS